MDKREFNDADFYKIGFDKLFEASLPRLGLMNGRYKLANKRIWYPPSSFIILTLAGTELRGALLSMA